MRFLIIDDSITMRRILSNTLAKLGHSDVVEASSGREALAHLAEGTVDVVITDWRMPDMNGLDLVRSLRNSPRTTHLPIMMVTANARSEDVVQALKSGVDGYVVKPFTPDTIRDKIAELDKK